MPTSKRLSFSVLICGLFLAALPASLAFAQPATDENPLGAQFDFGVGYSNITLGAGTILHDQSALHIEPGFSFAPFMPQLRLGIDVGSSIVFDDANRTLIANNGSLVIHGSGEVPLWTLEPELRVSWQQNIGPIFIEPGAAGGGMFGFLDLNSTDPGGGTYHSNQVTWYGKVFVRAGVQVPNGLFGVEGSYLTGGKMDFGGNASGYVHEYYIGVFGVVKF